MKLDEMLKEKDAVVNEAVSMMKEVDKIMKFDGNNIILEGEVLDLEQKPTQKRVKAKKIRVLETERVAQ